MLERRSEVGADDAEPAASIAKAYVGDASRKVCGEAIQVHGGIGFTWEHEIHLYLKRAHLDSISFGTATDHRARLARILRTKVEAGQSVL